LAKGSILSFSAIMSGCDALREEAEHLIHSGDLTLAMERLRAAVDSGCLQSNSHERMLSIFDTDRAVNTETGDEIGVSSFVLGAMCMLVIAMIMGRYVTFTLGKASPYLRALPPAGIYMLVGMVAGLIVSEIPSLRRWLGSEQYDFEQKYFFVMIVPPIIFNSGYNMKLRWYFANFTGTLLFAVLGTLISTFVIATIVYQANESGVINLGMTFSETVVLGSLLSTTDPTSSLAIMTHERVEPQAFYLIFGESVFNTQISIILYRVFASAYADQALSQVTGEAGGIFNNPSSLLRSYFLILLGSTCIGWILGCIFSYVLRLTKPSMKKHRVLEMSVYLLMCYIPYMVAEMLEVSGINTLLMSAVTMRHYAHRNLSGPASRETADFLFHFLYNIAEAVLFLDLGFAVFILRKHYNWPLIFITMAACFVSRMANIYPISLLLNLAHFRCSSQKSQQIANAQLLEQQQNDGTGAEVGEGGGGEEGEAKSEDGLESARQVASGAKRKIKKQTSAMAGGMQSQNWYIGWNTQHLMMFAGLRGTLTYALSTTFEPLCAAGYDAVKDEIRYKAPCVVNGITIADPSQLYNNYFEIQVRVCSPMRVCFPSAPVPLFSEANPHQHNFLQMLTRVIFIPNYTSSRRAPCAW
jgi:sodium/hydrogen exchanger 8